VAQFASANELADFLGRSIEDEEVARADLLLQLASAAVQAAAQQTIALVEDDEVSLMGNYSGELWLPERPVIDVSEITVRHGWGQAAVVTVPVGEIQWERRGLVQRALANVETNGPCLPYGGWGGPLATVDVTYSHGWQTVPDDLRGVALAVAARSFANPNGVRSKTIEGSISVTYSDATADVGVGLSEDEHRICRRYRPVR
jgi:hypothetical protein